jgi:hypothetical protein
MSTDKHIDIVCSINLNEIGRTAFIVVKEWKF